MFTKKSHFQGDKNTISKYLYLYKDNPRPYQRQQLPVKYIHFLRRTSELFTFAFHHRIEPNTVLASQLLNFFFCCNCNMKLNTELIKGQIIEKVPVFVYILC